MENKLIISFKDKESSDFIVFNLTPEYCESFATINPESFQFIDELSEKIEDFKTESLLILGITDDEKFLKNSAWSYFTGENLAELFETNEEKFWELVKEQLEFFFNNLIEKGDE